MTTASSEGEEFVQLLTGAQPRLFSYLTVLLGDVHEVNNVLQETNLAIWTKKNEFVIGTNFLAWARNIAYFKAMSFVRDRNREQLIVDQGLVDQALSHPALSELDPRRLALRHCLSELDERQLRLLRKRYTRQTPIAQIASEQGRTTAAVKMSLRRVRLALLRCIEKQTLATS